jgi:hypothetical protein
MTASPNLVANASLSNFRSNIAFSYFFYFSLTLLITRLLTKRQAPVFTFLLGLFCFLQLFYSHTNILKAIENNERDRERLIQQVNLFPDINKSNRVVVLQPPFDQTRVEPLYLDYRLNISSQYFIDGALREILLSKFPERTILSATHRLEDTWQTFLERQTNPQDLTIFATNKELRLSDQERKIYPILDLRN